MGTSYHQDGSKFYGKVTLHGGSLQQGNFINFHQTTNQCLTDLRVTDPRHDKKRIQDIKGGLLQDCYVWILGKDEFCQWRDNEDQRLLWVHGDPGKGKTMLFCGIIEHLENLPDEERVLSYFFCQASDQRINNAVSVMRGLMFLLLEQDASLECYIRKEYDIAGKALFEDANAWQAVSEIFMAILHDNKLQNVYLIIDALDECVEGLPELLDFIVSTSETTHVKWLVSSRNWQEIEEGLCDGLCDAVQKLSLELNAESISAAVDSYIESRVSVLARTKKYQKETAHEISQYLRSNADNTFLWVALVCKELERTNRWNASKKVKSIPSGLDPLYKRMMEYIHGHDDAKLCARVLALAATSFRPPSIAEFTTFFDESMEESSGYDSGSLEDIINLCGSFLAIREDIIYFVHQSAKDFLFEKQSAVLFPESQAVVHYQIFSRSIEAMSQTLKRDIYQLGHPGVLSQDVTQITPDPLARLAYSCVYWADHLHESGSNKDTQKVFQEGSELETFLLEKFLYWLEALSLLRKISEGVKAMEKLYGLLNDNHSNEVQKLIRDARRFFLSQKEGLKIAPLQVYTSALIFSPTDSLIKQSFGRDCLVPLEFISKVEADWNACLQTLVSSGTPIRSLAMSNDGRKVMVGSVDMRLWDTQLGTCLQTIQGHRETVVLSLAISPDGQKLAAGFTNGISQLWDTESGACLKTLEGEPGSVKSVALLCDGRWVACGIRNHTLELWDIENGVRLQSFESHFTTHTSVFAVAISSNGRRVACNSHQDLDIGVWNVKSGQSVQLLRGHTKDINSIAISRDGEKVASGSHDQTIKLWDVRWGSCLQTFQGHTSGIKCIAMSSDGRNIISGSKDKMLKLWDIESGACLQTLEGHSDWIYCVSTSVDGRKIVSGSNDGVIKLWDAEFSASSRVPDDSHSHWVESVILSPDGRKIASGSKDKTAKLWDAKSGAYLQTLRGHDSQVRSVMFSCDSLKVVSGSDDATVKLWNAESGICLQTLKGHESDVRSVVFSNDSLKVASGSDDGVVKVWDIKSGICLETLEGHTECIRCVVFSSDNRKVASGSEDGLVKIWDAESGACLQTLDTECSMIISVTFSNGDQKVACCSSQGTLTLWDAESGICLQTLDIGDGTEYLSFDPCNDSRLSTAAGDIILDPSFVDTAPSTQTTLLHNYSRDGYGISADITWITYDGKNLIWLPPEYRPRSSIVAGSTVVMGCKSGHVWVIRFSQFND